MLGDILDECIIEIVEMVYLDERIYDKVKMYLFGMK